MNRKMKELWKKKNCKIATFCLLAGIMGMMGMYFFSGEGKSEPNANKIAENTVEESKENNSFEKTDKADELETKDVAVVLKPKAKTEEKKEEQEALTEQKTTEKSEQQNTVALNFTEESRLIPPVNGEILMEYSMDKSIYFKTLDQYKYNAAQIIGAKEGAEVITAADGQVVEVKNDAETGLTVVMDLGNGYRLVYGQLKEVAFCAGDKVEAGELLGYVTTPTKYYVSEGSNLYFQMWKDDHTLNPADYMENSEQ